MVYRVGTYANRVEGNRGYLLEVEGRVVDEKISKFQGDNIKVNALEVILQGIRACRSRVSHEDLVIIEVQNTHLCDWLSGSVEYKEYSDSLDKIFEVLETLDCRYRFTFNKSPYAKEYLKGKGVTQVKVSSVADLMADFE